MAVPLQTPSSAGGYWLYFGDLDGEPHARSPAQPALEPSCRGTDRPDPEGLGRRDRG